MKNEKGKRKNGRGPNSLFSFFLFPFSFFLAATFVLAGCSSPNKPNIELRKQNSELRSQVESLQRQHQADAATIKSLESRGSTTAPSLALPSDRVAQLFTVSGLQFGKLTGADPDQPAGKALKVYVVPTDLDGEPIKAAGSFVVDAFDLAASGETRIGHWEFPLDQARKLWFGKALLYTYALPCPLEETAPQGREITIKVTFTDALTGRAVSAQKSVVLNRGR